MPPILAYRPPLPFPPDAHTASVALFFAALLAIPFAFVEDAAAEFFLRSPPSGFVVLLVLPAAIHAATAFLVRRAHRPSTLVALANTIVNLLAALPISAALAYDQLVHGFAFILLLVTALLLLYCVFLIALLYLLFLVILPPP